MFPQAFGEILHVDQFHDGAFFISLGQSH